MIVSVARRRARRRPFPHRAIAPPTPSSIARGAVPVPEGLASQIDPTLPFFASMSDGSRRG